MKNELSTEKTMTVKEVATVLGVDSSNVSKRVKELFPDIVQNGKQTLLDEYQVTMIKKAFLKNGKLGDVAKVESATTDIEMEQMTLKVIQYHVQKEQEYKQRAEVAEQKCIEQQPKVEVYDSICDSSTLQDLQTVAQTIGVKNIFKILIADGIIMKAWTKDKTMFYRPYAQYNDYLVTKDGNPYKVNGVAHVRPRIFVTAKGLLWLTKKYKEGK